MNTHQIRLRSASTFRPAGSRTIHATDPETLAQNTKSAQNKVREASGVKIGTCLNAPPFVFKGHPLAVLDSAKDRNSEIPFNFALKTQRTIHVLQAKHPT